MKPTQKSRIRLHRETLRDLSAGQLDRIAGGTMVIEPTDLVYGALVTDPNKNPRTNAWTTELDAAALCSVVR